MSLKILACDIFEYPKLAGLEKGIQGTMKAKFVVINKGEPICVVSLETIEFDAGNMADMEVRKLKADTKDEIKKAEHSGFMDWEDEEYELIKGSDGP